MNQKSKVVTSVVKCATNVTCVALLSVFSSYYLLYYFQVCDECVMFEIMFSKFMHHKCF